MRVKLPDNTYEEAYCPNTSRLIGLLDGTPDVLLVHNDNPDRKTDYTIEAFRDNETWVGIEAIRANEIFQDFLEEGDGELFNHWENWDREVKSGTSQFDFYHSFSKQDEWVEVKSLSSRTSEGYAFYSGTPSKRGYRHLDHLGDLTESGNEAYCVFIVQRDDVEGLVPADVTQDDWISSIREADARGVRIVGYSCGFDGTGWSVEKRIPAHLTQV